jgi:hypothetical protein
MAEKKSRGEGRTRNWTCIVYPESAPEQWREVLDEEHIPWIESPLHDKDLNADNTPKKAHWHVLLMFEGVKEYEQVKAITDRLNAPTPQKCNGAKGLVRYMAHLDNPEKVQYDRSAIVAHGGADLDALFTPTNSQRYQYIKEMSEFIIDNNILEFKDIWVYAMQERYDDWFPLLSDSCTMPIKAFITSRRHCRPPEVIQRVFVKDSVTGEILSETVNGELRYIKPQSKESDTVE